MAQIIINIPDAVLARVVLNYSDANNYATRANAGETRAAFAKRMLIEHLKTTAGGYEAAQAARAAQVAQTNQANADFNLT